MNANLEDHVKLGATTGGLLGCVAGGVATIWSGYELITVIDYALGIDVADVAANRFIIDIAIATVIAIPTITAGTLGGSAVGGLAGIAYHILAKTTSITYHGLAGLVSSTKKKNTEKKTD